MEQDVMRIEEHHDGMSNIPVIVTRQEIMSFNRETRGLWRYTMRNVPR